MRYETEVATTTETTESGWQEDWSSWWQGYWSDAPAPATEVVAPAWACQVAQFAFVASAND